MLSAPLIHGAYRGSPSLEPGAIVAMNFRRGRHRLAPGRGRLASAPTALPGFVSVGGAGFGYVKRSGVWTPIAANAPMIGDDGIEGWESAENQNPQSGELTIENGWALSSGSPPNRTPGHILEGLRATRFTTPIDVMAYRVYDETNGVWISPIGGNNTATPYGPGRISISIVAPVGCTALRIYPLRSQDNQTWTYKTFAVTPGQTYTARWLAAKDGNDYYVGCFEFRPGKALNDPPIQTGALPATRTGTDYRLGGLAAASTHYGVARVFWAAPYGVNGSPFPVAFEFAGAAGPSERILWRRGDAAGGAAFIVRIGNVNVFSPTTPGAPGTWETLAWRYKAGAHAISLGGAAPFTGADATPTPVLTTLGLLGNSQSASNQGNGKMSEFYVWNGDISDADLQALSARFTYG